MNETVSRDYLHGHVTGQFQETKVHIYSTCVTEQCHCTGLFSCVMIQYQESICMCNRTMSRDYLHAKRDSAKRLFECETGQDQETICMYL